MKLLQMSLRCIFLITLICACENVEEREIVAEVENEKIYLEDIDDLIPNSLYEYLYAIFDTRRITLAETIDNKLLRLESESTSIDPDSIIALGVLKMKGKRSKAEFIQENALQNGVIEDGNPFKTIPLDSEDGKVILDKSYLLSLRREYLEELRSKYSVKIYLKPPSTPEINLSRINKYSRGNLNSNISICLISDFTCPICQSKESVFQELFNAYKSKVRFEYIHLSSSINTSIVFSECAAKQGKFWEAYNILFKQNIRDSNSLDRTIQLLKLKKEECIKCMSDKHISLALLDNMERLRILGLNLTPTILINNRIYYGEISTNSISQFIDREVDLL
jgi:protein-disulfide isomerase